MYPDVDDMISVSLFRQWDVPYYSVNELCIKMVQSYIFADNKGLLIDIGCGTGSMINYFVKDFSKIIGIDPDKERLLKAKQRLKNKVEKRKVFFICSDIAKINLSLEADFIIFKDVLQHMPTYILRKALRNLQQLVSKQGHVLFALPINPHGEFYVLCHRTFQNESNLICNEIDKKTFNASCDSKSNQVYLATHVFHLKKVLSLIGKYFYFNKMTFLQLNYSSFELIAIVSKYKNISIRRGVVEKYRLEKNCNFTLWTSGSR